MSSNEDNDENIQHEGSLTDDDCEENNYKSDDLDGEFSDDNDESGDSEEANSNEIATNENELLSLSIKISLINI